MSTRALPLALLIAPCFASCSSTMPNIAAVLQEGHHANGRVVTLIGDVVGVPETGPSGHAYYELTDGSGRISVETQRSVPPSCHTVRLKGKVESVFANATNNARPGVVYARWWVGLSITEISRDDLGPSLTAQFTGCR